MSEKKKHVLIIEDEVAMARALQLKLQSEGFEADVVHNGSDGVESLKKGHYDVALLDLVMPVMDGFAVLEQVKKLKIKTPIIVSTNLSQEEDRERATSLGAVDFFVKSNTPIHEVIDHVKKIVG